MMKKVVVLLSTDPDPLPRVDLRNVNDLAGRIRKAIYADAMEFMRDDDSRDLTRFLAIAEAVAGIFEIELRMSDFVRETNPTTQRGTKL